MVPSIFLCPDIVNSGFGAGVLGGYFFQQAARVPVHVQEAGGNADYQKNQFPPRACVKPIIQAAAQAKTHQWAADQMETYDARPGQGLHTVLLLTQNVLKHSMPYHIKIFRSTGLGKKGVYEP
jgi:hypothetical protein